MIKCLRADSNTRHVYNLAYAAAASENWVNKSDSSFECRSNKQHSLNLFFRTYKKHNFDLRVNQLRATVYDKPEACSLLSVFAFISLKTTTFKNVKFKVKKEQRNGGFIVIQIETNLAGLKEHVLDILVGFLYTKTVNQCTDY